MLKKELLIEYEKLKAFVEQFNLKSVIDDRVEIINVREVNTMLSIENHELRRKWYNKMGKKLDSFGQKIKEVFDSVFIKLRKLKNKHEKHSRSTTH